MKLKLIFAALILAVSVVPATAAPNTGQLQNMCKIVSVSGVDGVKTPTEAIDAGLCIGFFTGFWAGIDGMSAVDPKTGKAYTVSVVEGVTVGQMIRVYVKYTTAHPELENQSAGGTAIDAFTEAKIIGFTLTPVTPTSYEH